MQAVQQVGSGANHSAEKPGESRKGDEVCQGKVSGPPWDQWEP